ncbi:MAG: PAS domain S-box protein, partial [Pseudobdellovibrionaceae bacterium]
MSGAFWNKIKIVAYKIRIVGTRILFRSTPYYSRKVEVLRGKAEDSIKKRESKFASAQPIGNFGTWSWDIKTNHRQWSDEVFRIFGLRPQQHELTPESVSKYIHPEDQDVIRNAVNEAITNGKQFNIECRILRADGVERVIQVIGEVFFGSDGSSREMTGTLHDVTEKKRIETNLRESEAKFRGLLETAYDSILIVNKDGNIEFANQQTKNWLGYEPEELIGKPIEILVPDRFSLSHLRKRNEFMKQLKSRPMGQNLQLFAKRKDGSEFPVEISLSPYKTSDGTIVTVFLKDMTDQKRSEEQQRFLAETSHVLSETLDYHERIQRITDLVVPHLADWCSVHTVENEQLKLKALAHDGGSNCDLIKHFAENNCFLQEESSLNFGAVAKSGNFVFIENITDQIIKQFTAGDKIQFQQLEALRMQSLILLPMEVRGQIIGVISFIRCKPLRYNQKDLEFAKLVAARASLAIDNARLYQEAQNAIGLREDILAIVSHDLRNPLGAIRGFNELLSESIRNSTIGPLEIQSTNAIARSVKQMERLIGDLLDFAKIESGTFAIEPKLYTVDRLIWEGIELVKKLADQKG